MFGYSQPLLFGELAIMLWLLIKGVRLESAPQPGMVTA
jgi:hypothetical protein